MGYWYAIAGVASAAIGSASNSKAQKANDAATQAAREDYQQRLLAAGKGASELLSQYNDVVEERPGLSWESFVKDRIKSLDDPILRDAYVNAKSEDYEKLKEFASVASTDNYDNLFKTFDSLTNGKGQEILNRRTDLVLSNNAPEQFARAYELAAPIRTDASTVKYDKDGRLIEGQRSDKVTFGIAQEVQQQADDKQLQQLRDLQADNFSIAEQQKQTAKDFMGFFDATGFSTAVEDSRQAQILGFQTTDETRAFDLYNAFAQASIGIQPTQPTLQNPTPGNQLISDGTKLVAEGASKYYSSNK